MKAVYLVLRRKAIDSFIKYCALIPFFGTLILLMFPLFNDDIAEMMIIGDDKEHNTLVCAMIQFFSWLILAMELGIIAP